MGLFDFLLGKEKDKEEKKEKKIEKPLKIQIRFLPLRLNEKMDNDIDMIVRITNISDSDQLVSFDALLPKNVMLGFDRIVVNKRVEKKLGKIKPNETKQFSIKIYANTQTKNGEYPIRVVANTHYLNYDKVINKIKKELKIRVV